MNLKSNILIILNGEIISDIDLSFYSKIFPVDGGGEYLKNYSIIPDIMIGDFDSISKNTLDYFKKNNTKIISYPSKKDYSDLELTLYYISENYNNINIDVIGCFSDTRIDHFLVNLEVFARFADKFTFNIIDKRFKQIISSKNINIECIKNVPISILSMSDKCIFEKSTGLEYNLKNITIERFSSKGLSNKTKTSRITVVIREGIFSIILPAG
ncbi:MAG: thiamine diphosphokinase [Candidatus Muirbacterium halophilum]|nr:thiamine diphosphokinase [Candidatus Muirbacterium halophilum]MCK9474462.1 thiamine diphosphokinase [Candidatus Muirbacterium halophilum]